MTKTFTLKFPFEFDGEKVTQLTVRRPKPRDMKKAYREKDEIQRSVVMISDLAEVSPALVDDMDMQDFQDISDYVGECMGVSAG